MEVGRMEEGLEGGSFNDIYLSHKAHTHTTHPHTHTQHTTHNTPIHPFLHFHLPLPPPTQHTHRGLIAHPDSLFSGGFVAIFFVSYFLIVGVVLMNIVVAVLLDEVPAGEREPDVAPPI